MIALGDTVVVRSYEDRQFNIVKVDGEQKIGKSRISLKEFVGKPYGSVFEISQRKLIYIPDSEMSFEDPTEPVADNDFGVALRKADNSSFVDTNTAQKLTDSDISKLRESGHSGQDIIRSLIENSDTFTAKTEFSQAKYIRKKVKKYKPAIRVYRSTPATLCEAYYTKSKDKICGMRQDSFAQVLSQSGIHSGSRVLVVESTVGLVVGAVAYRLRGHGRILPLYGGQQPHIMMVGHYNLEEKDVEIIRTVPAVELGPAAEDIRKFGFSKDTPIIIDSTTVSPPSIVTELVESTHPTETNESTTLQLPVNAAAVQQSTSIVETTKPEASETGDHDVVVDACMSNNKKRKNDDANNSKNSKINKNIENFNKNRPKLYRHLNLTGRTPEEQGRLRMYLRQGVDSLIIACKYRPLPILQQALVVLSPSSPFVVYHEFLEPLVECYLYLQQNSLALRLVLSDTWMREFQTLPGRTRPDMNMSTSGGYVLSGINADMTAANATLAATNK